MENVGAALLQAGVEERSPGVQSTASQNMPRNARLAACSACTADYEDPDATCWDDDCANDEEDEQTARPEEFPARLN